MSARSYAQTKPNALASPSFTRAPTGRLQRQCACGQKSAASGACSSCQAEQTGLQRQATSHSEPGAVPSLVHEVLRAPGQPLDATIRDELEPRFGHDFSRVRVHTDARAAESARAIHALAYTVGQSVVFGAGQFQPGTSAGRRLLAHELTHVVQQGNRAATLEPHLVIGPSRGVWEQEADRVANSMQSDGERSGSQDRDSDPARQVTRVAQAGAGMAQREDAPGIIPAGPLDLGPSLDRARRYEPQFRPHVPSAPTLSWAQRVGAATRLTGRQRVTAFLNLINEALAVNVAMFPELRFPVVLFRSNAAAVHGEVSLDSTSSSEPGQPGLRADTRTHRHPGEPEPRGFIVITPGALHPEAGPDFTRRVVQHEYVHFLQNLRGELTVRPACRGAFRGRGVGGNPNREVVAVSTTFARFFPMWADRQGAAAASRPHHIFEDLALLQASFHCATEDIQNAAIGRIVASVGENPRRRQLLLALIREVRELALLDTTLAPANDAMARLAQALGAPLGRDPRLPAEPVHPRPEPLFDMRRFMERSFERMPERMERTPP